MMQNSTALDVAIAWHTLVHKFNQFIPVYSKIVWR